MQRINLFVLILLATITGAQAQNEMDALRYSLFAPGGTARFMSMGGAFGALGGDFSTLSTNPAGIAIYRSSEFTITPNLNFNSVGSSFYGTTEEDFKYDFSIGNIGLVLAFNDPNQLKENGWTGFHFGFGMNRHMNFNNRRIYEGFNTQSSLMTDYLFRVNEAGINPANPQGFHPFTTDLAWQTLLIDTLGGQFIVDMFDGNVLQRRETHSSGSVRELLLTVGGNYANRLYVGATFGFPSVRFEEEFTYTETDTQNENIYFNSLEYRETLNTSGSGFNFKFGMIYRATDMIRIGAAVHTPTFYSLEDEWRSHMKSNLSFGNYSASSPRGRFSYDLNTPLRLMGSLGLVFQSAGILSIDYEYADYSKMRLRSSESTFSAENRVIRDSFTAQHNIRLGGEIRLNPIVLRAGYALHTNPYKSGVNELEKSTLSAGIGLRDQHYFIDFGTFFTQYSEDFYPYAANLTQAVNYDYRTTGFLITFGFRF